MSMTPDPALTPAEPATEETRYEFHRLMRRSENYAWWRPLAIGGTTLGFYLASAIILGLFVLLAMLLNPLTWVADSSSTVDETVAADLNMADPADFSLVMMSLIIMIPAAILAYLLLGPKPWGMLLSVAGRLRWKWLGLCAAVSAVLFFIYFALSFALEFSGLVQSEPVPLSSLPLNPLFMALLVILLVPFQSAAEEIIFRGMLMQSVGSWLKHPAFAILLPVPLFVIGHEYDLFGQLDVAIFAIAAGYLTWKTGGLEAAIAVHVMNNVGLFLLASAGLVDVNASGSSLSGLLASGILTVVLTYVLITLANRRGIARTAGAMPVKQESSRLLQPWPIPYPPVHANQPYWAPPVDAQQPAYQPVQPFTEVHPGQQPPTAPPSGTSPTDGPSSA